MKRLVIAALTLVAVGVVAGSALAAGGNGSSVIYDSTNPNGPPTNLPSYGPEAYAFQTIGDQITFKSGTARTLNSATVTLSSWACQHGTWQDQSCVTPSGATFSQPITLKVYDPAKGLTTPIAESTQTFDVPYRPSASPKCIGTERPGGWYQPSTKLCKNGLTDDVTFNFSHVALPDTVQYEISYNTSNYGPNPLHAAGPYDSLNVAVTSSASPILIDGQPNSGFGNYTPVVQFKAGNGN